MNNTVTIEDVKRNMQEVEVVTITMHNKPFTLVQVKLENGFTVRETTTCVDPANYDEEIGKQVCLKKIEDKVWLLLGYELQSKLDEKTPFDKCESCGKIIYCDDDDYHSDDEGCYVCFDCCKSEE